MLDHIRTVLLKTTHTGNIGAVARALKTMGLSQLYLVNPKTLPDEEAEARASGGIDVLKNARVFTELDQAIKDCGLVLGTSVRERSIGLPVLTPREAAEWVRAHAGNMPVAILFGRERDGLSNEELDRCQRVVTIPTNPEYGSLNIASAVQIMAYELKIALEEKEPSVFNEEEQPATAEELASLWKHLEETLIATEFLNPDHPGHTMRKLQRMLVRADLTAVEVRIWRGILSSVQKK